jgi:hypothetical protein
MSYAMNDYPFEERHLKNPITFSALTTQSMNIPRDKFIQFIQLDLKADISGDAQFVESQYGILDLIRRIKLISNGSDIHFSVPFRFWYLHNYFDFIHPNNYDHIAQDSAEQLIEATVIIPFMYDDRNPMDVSAVIPAFDYSSLVLEVDWGDHTDLEATATATVNSAYLYVTLYEVKKLPDLPVRDKRLVWSMQSHPFSQSSNDLRIDMKVGSNIRRIFLEVLDDGDPSDALVNYVLVKQNSPFTREYFFHRYMFLKHRHDALQFHKEGDVRANYHYDQGWVVIVADRNRQMDCWFNTQGLKTGDLSLFLDVNAPTNNNGVINVYYEEEQL